MKLKTPLALALALCLSAGAQAATEIVIATVNNGHMIEMQKLTPHFEKANPDIKVKWVTLEEGVLRQRVTTDIATKGGQFDVMTIGMYETPIWGKKGWLNEIKPDAAYDVDDLLPAMRNGLSVDGKLYAAPFYGESSMLMYRKDLADKAGVKFAERPTWTEVKDAAAKMHDPKAGVYGICLRGKPGWGDNMAFLSTMANSFGAQWFDMSWKPQLDSKPWKDAVTFLRRPAEELRPPGLLGQQLQRDPGALQRGQVRDVGRCHDRRLLHHRPRSRAWWADKVAFAQGPYQATQKGANWLWAWALAVPAGTKNAAAAQKFITWADLQGVHQPGRQGEGLGGSAHRHAQVDLCQRRVPEGGGLRRGREEGDRQRQPERQHPAQEPVRGRAVRRHPGVPGDRPGGGAADELAAGRQDLDRRCAEGLADRRPNGR